MADLSIARLESSNLPVAQKSAIKRFYENAMSRHGGSISRVKAHAVGTGHAVRKGGEGLVVGAVLGAFSSHSKTGLDIEKVPVDAAAGVLLLGASVMFAGESVAPDLANAGGNALAVFGFRKTEDYMNKRKSTVAGEYGSTYGKDPIVELARRM